MKLPIAISTILSPSTLSLHLPRGFSKEHYLNPESDRMSQIFLEKAEVLADVKPSCIPETYLSQNWIWGGDSQGGVWYLPVDNNNKMWNDSMKSCMQVEKSSQLGIVLDSNENEKIADYILKSQGISGLTKDYWLAGFSFNSHSNGWFWYENNGEKVEARSMKYFNWYKSVSSDPHSDCIYMKISETESNGKMWNKMHCDKLMNYDCEVRCQ